MYWDVKSVEVVDAYKLKIKFADNLEGVVNISKKWLTGVFAPLIDMKLFNKGPMFKLSAPLAKIA